MNLKIAKYARVFEFIKKKMLPRIKLRKYKYREQETDTGKKNAPKRNNNQKNCRNYNKQCV